MKLSIGTRGSRLGIAQTNLVIDVIRSAHPEVDIELRHYQTSGDMALATPIHELGETAFTDRLEQALLDGEIDLAVHSFKDLPPESNDALIVGAIPFRADRREALVSRDGSDIAGLPARATVGVSSERRTAALRALRADLQARPIRGPVDVRVAKVDQGEYDATILAVAGLERLGLGHRISQIFEPEVIRPAAGQGALAVQCRSSDDLSLRLLATIDDPRIRREVEAERMLELAGA